MSRLLVASVIISLIVTLPGCELIDELSPTDDSTIDEEIDEEQTVIEEIIFEPLELTGETITRSFSWEYNGTQWTWQLDVPKSLYDYYRGMPRTPTDDYSVYVTHPEDDDYIGILVDKLLQTARQAGLDEIQTVDYVVAFVQSLPYTSDDVTTSYDEYPRYPLETLVDNGGDCEDTAILMTALLYEMGYGVVLLDLPGHMAVGVLGEESLPGYYWDYKDGRYYYLETTGEGWGIGELPDAYIDASVFIHEIIAVPIITHNWEGSSIGLDYTINVTVENLGTAVATDIYIYAGFDAGDGLVWNPEQSNTFDLAPGTAKTITVRIQSPPDIHTRIIVQIVDDEYSVSESYSEWMDT